MESYKVTVTVQHPAWNERDGFTFYVEASTKAEAIKAARRENQRDGIIHSQHGRATWRAAIAD